MVKFAVGNICEFLGGFQNTYNHVKSLMFEFLIGSVGILIGFVGHKMMLMFTCVDIHMYTRYDQWRSICQIAQEIMERFVPPVIASYYLFSMMVWSPNQRSKQMKN